MNKQLIIIGLAAFLSCAALSGCNEQIITEEGLSTDEQKFVGTWKSEDSKAFQVLGETVEFFSDGKVTPSNLRGISGNYEIRDGKLVLSFNKDGNSADYIFNYFFSGNNKVNLQPATYTLFNVTYNKQ